MKRFTSLLLITVALFGCTDAPQPSVKLRTSDVEGSYRGVFSNASVTLVLKKNDTYKKTLMSQNKVSHSIGRWRLYYDSDPDLPNKIILPDGAYPIDTSYGLGKLLIMLDEDEPLVKQPSPPLMVPK